jgi:hypothetical protein
VLQGIDYADGFCSDKLQQLRSVTFHLKSEFNGTLQEPDSLCTTPCTLARFKLETESWQTSY